MLRWCLLFFVVGLMTPLLASALGVGELVVTSHLGEPLDATIDLELTPKESLDQITARVGSAELHNQLGLSYASILGKIHIAKHATEGGARLQLRTAQPVDEVIVSFVLQVSYGESHVLREFTAFLDPQTAPEPVPVNASSATSPGGGATVRQRQSAPADTTPAPRQSSPASSGVVSSTAVPTAPARHARAAPVTTTTTTRVVVQDVAPATPKQHATARKGKSRPGKYGVVDGVETYGPTLISDSLGFIGRKFRPDKSVNLNQLMLALYRQNTDAFVAGNINRLKAGYYLQLKDPDDIASISRKEAARQVGTHNRVWRSGASLPSPVTAANDQKNSSGKGVRKVPPRKNSKLDGAATSKARNTKNRKPVHVAERDFSRDAGHESQVSPTRAVEMLGTQRIPGAEQAYIEDRVALMEQRLLELQEVYASKTLLVAQLETRRGQPALAPQTVPIAAIVPVPIVETSARFTIPGTEDGGASTDATAATPIDQETVPGTESVPEAKVATRQESRSEPPGTPESSLLKTILLVAGFVAVLCGVFVAIWLRYRRPGPGKAPVFQHYAEIPVLDDAEDLDAKAVADNHEAAGFNPLDTMVAAKLSVMRGDSEHAIEMLKHSLVRDPRNEEYRMVLLETLYKAKNSSLFGLHANIYADIFGKDTPAWERIARMGRIVAPDLNIFGASEMDAYIEEAAPTNRFITDETTGEDEEELDAEMFTSDALSLLEKAEASLGEVALEMNFPSDMEAGADVQRSLEEEGEEIVMGEAPGGGSLSAPSRSAQAVASDGLDVHEGDAQLEKFSLEFTDDAIDSQKGIAGRKHATG